MPTIPTHKLEITVEVDGQFEKKMVRNKLTWRELNHYFDKLEKLS